MRSDGTSGTIANSHSQSMHPCKQGSGLLDRIQAIQALSTPKQHSSCKSHKAVRKINLVSIDLAIIVVVTCAVLNIFAVDRAGFIDASDATIDLLFRCSVHGTQRNCCENSRVSHPRSAGNFRLPRGVCNIIWCIFHATVCHHASMGVRQRS